MSFRDDVLRFVVKVKARTPAVALSVATKAHASIKEGSATTGAPGQPVSTGFLKNSWILAPGKDSHEIRTNVAYAPVIEYNSRAAYDPSGKVDRFGVTGGHIGPALPAGFHGSTRAPKSTVGGHGSVRLTIAGADRLQEEAVRELGP